ncbi:MAG TPA: hypothetical protein VIM41_01760 [Gammaproteobacteria bacterium]
MPNEFDLDTIAKEYAEGRISKEDFLYLHKMLTTPSAKKPSPAQQPPMLRPARPVKVTTSHSRQVKPPAQPAAAQHSSINTRPDTRPEVSTANTRKQHDLSIPSRRAVAPPPVFVPQKKATFFGYVRKHHKEVVALLGTTGIFISMFYNNVKFPSFDSGNARVVVIQSQPDQEKKSPGLRTQDIKLVAELMMDDNSWNKELIEDFLAHWQSLSDNEKLTVRDATWYKKFSAMLAQQLKISRLKAKTGDVAAIYNQQALLQLADNLVFGNNQEAKQTLASVAGSDSKPSAIERDQDSQSDTPKAVQEQDAPPVRTAKITGAPVNKSNTEQLNRPSRDAEANRHRISRQEVEDVISRFVAAFESGHTPELISLFANEDHSSSVAELNRVKAEYQDLIRVTQDRHLELSSLFWEHDFDEARGSAKYKANLRKKGKDDDLTLTANLDLTLRRVSGKVYITEFKLSGREEVVAKKPQSKPNSSKNATLAFKEKPDHPTQAELQELITRYITAYETGNVKDMMRLFENATWASSTSGLEEMKQLYQTQFENTSGREIFVNNIDWDFKDKKAMGTGDLILTFRTKDKKLVTQKGKIRIMATREGEDAQISQIFHVMQ